MAWRVKANLKLPVETVLADGSYLSTIYSSADPQRRYGETVRVIDYTLAESATPVDNNYRLITNILDERQTGALGLAALYHEHWEIEGVFDEIKTHLRGASTILRSKKPGLVEQELWGLLRTAGLRGGNQLRGRSINH